jgi:hypothetical protein
MQQARIETPDLDESGGLVDLEEGDAFEVQSNRRRRYASHYLKHVGCRPVDIVELPDHAAAWEHDKEPRCITTEERNRVATALRVIPLPKIEETGVFDYDGQRGETVPREAAADLDAPVEVPGPDAAWRRYYLGLAGVNTVLLAAATSAGPLAGLTTLAVVTFAVGTLAAPACVRAHYTSGLRVGDDDTTQPEVGSR